jgi:hypothetical protein
MDKKWNNKKKVEFKVSFGELADKQHDSFFGFIGRDNPINLPLPGKNNNIGGGRTGCMHKSKEEPFFSFNKPNSSVVPPTGGVKKTKKGYK